MKSASSLTTRSPQRMSADTSRVITRMFVPGQEGFEQRDSRAGAVTARILALDEATVRSSLDDVWRRFRGRHRDLEGTFRRHAGELADRLAAEDDLSEERMMLLGATFTHEYAIEGAALCNPSMVIHPDQSGVADGAVRFVMSVRGIGEGHLSSIGFRSGIIDAAGRPSVDEPAPLATVGATRPSLLEAAVFRVELARADSWGAAEYVLSGLGEVFTRAELDERLAELRGQQSTRGRAQQAVETITRIAERTYAIEFESTTTLSERVLWPAMHAEAAGMEDARFVRFVDDDNTVTYYASYTAYSGSHISQQLLQTEDFRSFTSTPMVGSAAANKGLAIFPRRIGGRFAAMSRADRESNTITFSDRPFVWTGSSECQRSLEDWEVMQLGNCGPPLETEAGWLVLTHGVGPMRTYRMGALLLDLSDPTTVLGRLREPLLAPEPDEQNGYVPNVVYSCGAMIHAGTLVVPYGIGDAAIGMATVPLDDLLGVLDG